MEPAGQKRFARIALVVLAVLGLAWLARLDYGEKISTNIIDLIPSDERSPEVSLVRSIVGDRQARVMLFVLQTDGRAATPAAADAFVSVLRASGQFSEALALADPSVREALGRFLFEKRLDLLLPGWLAARRAEFAATGRPAAEFSAWLADESVRRLDTFLTSPESVAFQELVPADPLLLLPALAERAEALGFSNDSREASRVWAILEPSPFAEEGQAPVLATIERAREAARRVEPAVELRWTGVNRFAAASKERIRGELSLLNTLSIAAVVLVACVFVRRIWKVLHLVPVILFSILGAWVGATLLFDRLHILVFVIGSLLTGVAVDYGFYLYMQPLLRPDERYAERVRRLLKPLLTSCITTVIGFSFLLFSELPLIRQLGVFVSAGLISALAGALLYFAQLDRPLLETRTLPRPDTRRWRVPIRALGACAALAMAFGLTRLEWRDDVRELEVPSPALQANDQAVRAFFGDRSDRVVYITRGDSLAQARAALDRFHAWLRTAQPEGSVASAAWLIPSPEAWAAMPELRAQLGDFPARFSAALAGGGYEAGTFEPFFAAWRESGEREAGRLPYAEAVRRALETLQGPLSLLSHAEEGSSWFVSISDQPTTALPPPDLATVPVSQLESLNSLFTRYRHSALKLSGLGLGIVGLSVFVLYGLRRGMRIFAIPAGSCLAAFGLLGLMGEPLNLFHLLGAFLGVCLSHNYAIFSAENAGRSEAPPPSIRLSALTTSASFGVLAFSQIPVVAALGAIVALIVMLALLAVELEPLAATP